MHSHKFYKKNVDDRKWHCRCGEVATQLADGYDWPNVTGLDMLVDSAESTEIELSEMYELIGKLYAIGLHASISERDAWNVINSMLIEIHKMKHYPRMNKVLDSKLNW